MTLSLLTVKDMAIRLQVKEKTIYAWASQGKIPYVKVNGAIRFTAREIEHWLQHCHVPMGPPHRLDKNTRKDSTISVDHLIESATRAVYTARGETRPVASPEGKE